MPITIVSGENTPLKEPSLRSWIDYSDPAQRTLESGGFVSQVNDLSGNGFHETATGSERPTVGVGTNKGRDVLIFDGVANRLTVPTGVFDVENDDFTIIVVCKKIKKKYDLPAPINNDFIFTAHLGSGKGFAIKHSTGNHYESHVIRNGQTTNSRFGTHHRDTNEFVIHTVRVQGHTITWRRNKENQPEDGTSSQPINHAVGYYVGCRSDLHSSTFAEMEICEKLIFNSVLSDKSVEIQEKYLEIKHKVNRVPSTNPIGYIGTPNTDIVPCTLRFGMKETGSIFSSFARMGTPGASDVFVGTADSGASRIEYFCNEMQTMQRQAGSIISVKLATSTGNQSSNITGVKIGWWREDGANWDLVAYSEDISTQVKAAANNSIVDITFVTPVAGVAEYDRLSIVIETSALVTDVFRTCKGLHTVASSYTTTGAEVTADKDWSSETVSTEFVPIVCSMQAPQIISIGDSLTVGFPLNNNGIHPVETASTTFEVTDPTTNIVKLVADNYSWTYQNLGDPGDATGELIRRYIWHIGDIKPRACIIWIGANDLSGGGETEENYFNRIYELINFCNSEKVIPILMNIHPAASSWFTDSRSATRREFNDIIATLGTELGAIVIDTATVVAVIRLSTGELDDIDPVYAQDTVHYNPTGCAAIASAIISEIDSL